MRNLYAEVEEMVANFASALLEAARSAPLAELIAETTGGSRVELRAATSPPAKRRARPAAKGRSAGNIPRGVRGAPTAELRAVEWQRQLASGEVRSRADIARREGLTRARVTQIMNLLRSEEPSARKSSGPRRRSKRSRR